MSAREAILEAAAELAAKEGVTALGVERVNKHAGVSKGSFFYHFKTKEEMIHALVAKVSVQCMENVERDVSKGRRFTDALIDMVFGQIKEEGALIGVLVAAVLLDKKMTVELHQRSEDWKRRMVEEDGLPEARASLLRMAIDGLMIGTVLYGRMADEEIYVEARRNLERLASGNVS